MRLWNDFIGNRPGSIKRLSKREIAALDFKSVHQIYIDSGQKSGFVVMLKMNSGETRWVVKHKKLAFVMAYAMRIGKLMGLPENQIRIGVEAIEKNKDSDQDAMKAYNYVQTIGSFPPD